MPRALSLLGPATIPAIAEFLADADVDEMARISAPACLERIAVDHPAQRDACVRVLEDQLARHAANGPALNGFVILSLVELGATEALETIRSAFGADNVDLSILGDIEDAEIALGIRTHRATRRPRLHWFGPPSDVEDRGAPIDDFHGMLAQPITNPMRHVGRNDPCPCGSGRKFKRCCGAR